MQSKHVVFAALICIFCAGAVIAAVTGQSETISTANSGPQITLTPVTPPPTEEISVTEDTPTPDTTIPSSDISTSSTTTPNDTQTATATSDQ